MRKILLVAYSFPPVQDPQALRWYYLSNFLVEKGFQIDILTAKLPEKFRRANPEFPLNEGISLKETFPGLFDWMFFYSKGKIGSDIEVGRRRKRLSFRILRKVYRGFRWLLEMLLAGDIRFEWFPYAVASLNRFNFSDYEVFITSQEPVVDSIIGLYLKRKTGLKWIADLGDVTSTPYYGFWKGVLEKLESKVVKRSDAIMVTGTQPKNWLIERHSLCAEKVHIVTQGFSLKNCSEWKKNGKNQTFTMAFTGTFYEGFRDPKELCEALSKLEFNFKFVLAGRNERFLKCFEKIGNKLDFKGFISHFEALKVQKEADVLIHMTNKQLNQVPGKFYEYLGSGTPILTIYYDPLDETVALTKKLSCGLACENREEEIKSSLTCMFSLWKDGKLDSTFNTNCEDFKEFSWEEGAEKLTAIIEKLVS